MTPMTRPDKAWSAGLAFWCTLWQQQIDQTMKIWAAWGAMVPRESARELAAQAEAMKASSARRTSASSA
ncbi:MAG: hypothetical protein Kow0013_07420 [Pararhodobacter sp.]